MHGFTDGPFRLPDEWLRGNPDACRTDNPCGGSILFPRGKGRSPHLPGTARAGACIYQINELVENAPVEKPDAYVPLVALKRVTPNVMHSAPFSGKHVAL